jgi:RNA polymerase sigma factor (sigma-70 family)
MVERQRPEWWSGSDRNGRGRPLEDQLVERARKGDIDAYEELVRLHQTLAQRVAYVVLGSEAEAQDATQEAFVKAYYALGSFRTGASFRAWLMAIVRNEALNRVRSASRRTSLVMRVAEDRSLGAAAPSPEAAVLAAERSAALGAALGSLAPRDRVVIALRYFEDLSEKEMAVALDCPPGTVKSRLSRALSKLKSSLPEDEVVTP